MARLAAVLLALCAGTTDGAEVGVAVASNFAPALERIAADYVAGGGDRLRISTGSTGKLYAQIVQGAPFDVLLAADSERPARLERDGLAVPGSRFTYAVGRLVLWSNASGAGDRGLDLLRDGSVRKIALANPRTAPYGVAARQVLERDGAWTALADKLVFGESVGQTYQFVASGNADAGFIALSQWIERADGAAGSHWVVPADAHEPIEQQAVLLVHGRALREARRFLAHLRSDEVRAMLAVLGYPAD